MSLYQLEYKWQGHAGTLTLDREGVFYLDLSEPKVVAYANPTDGPMAVLTATRKKVFLVYEGKGFDLGPSFISAGALEVSVQKKEDFFIDYKKVLNLVLNFVKPYRHYWKKPAVLGGAALFLILIILVSSFTSKNDSQSTRLEMELEKMAPDLSAQELAVRRLKLAENYLKEKNYTLSLDMADKVLAYQPDQRLAIKIKEKALSMQDKAKTETQAVLKRELRLKSLLDDAADLMARSDFLGASLVVEQVLTEDPKNAEAYRMGEAVKKELAKIDEKKKEASLSDREKTLDAEKLWQEGKQAFEEKKYAEARPLLSQAYAITEGLTIQPVFRLDLKELQDQNETNLNQIVQPMIEKAREKRNAGDKAEGLVKIQSYQAALGAYFEAEKIFADYPLLQQEIDLTLQGLNEAVSPHFVEAQTILGLEGCCAAESYLQKVMTLAKYDRVPTYLKARELMEQCPCQ